MEYPATLTAREAKQLIAGANRKLRKGEERTGRPVPQPQHWTCRRCQSKMGMGIKSCPVCYRVKNPMPGTPEGVHYKEPTKRLEKVGWVAVMILGAIVVWAVAQYF